MGNPNSRPPGDAFAISDEERQRTARIKAELAHCSPELQARFAELELAAEQALYYARDLSAAFQAERRRARELQQAFNALEGAYEGTLRGLVQALDARDRETEGHSLRVALLTSRIAQEMGVNGEELLSIERGALLHDLGKIGVPDAILHKEGPLTPAEWRVMRKHPTIGYRMLEGIDFLQDARLLVFHHHERYDGKGYPNGLAGEEICLGARIFAVVDTLDAMTWDRPYRRALSWEEALAEIARCRGTQFDPDVVDVFLRIAANLRQVVSEVNPMRPPRRR